ncbi:hypothetical protein Bhyg_12680 [Pseudolycoriella hygida]|uniref:Uncharacterized protein n=1 Tax=Pseudolycoriella hygida TaxID=35572 RepID=A0A9Q0S1H5_9DIPT|nr:hypothetical protein Bhyg_12680 [Pseudolycoriella hygida]
MDEENNGISLGSEYLELNDQSQFGDNRMFQVNVGNEIPTPFGYSELELSKYNMEPNEVANARNEEIESKPSEILDEFFEDFNEIFTTEMKPTISLCDQTQPDSAPTMISSDAYHSAVSDIDLNSLDLAPFFVNINEADYLDGDELKTDFANEIIQFPQSQFAETYEDKASDDQHSALNLFNANMNGDNEYKYMETGNVNQIDLSAASQSDDQMKISVSTPMNQFYIDLKPNGEDTSGTNGSNSVVAYVSEDSLRGVQYINDNGLTETVMYLDPQSNEIKVDNNGNGVSEEITRYEIIDLNECQYVTESVDSLQHKDVAPDVQDSADNQQTDILTVLTSDKSNKIIFIAKPLQNPKIRRSSGDEIFSKFEEIDEAPTNIPFIQKTSKEKSSRKQKLGRINQVEHDFDAPKCSQPKRKSIDATSTKTPNYFPETPKIPSKFMILRRTTTLAGRKRRLLFDSESDCVNSKQLKH